MATYYDDDYVSSGDEETSGGVSLLLNWAGALLSVGLLAGLTIWGYQLLMRDVTGVPVIQAIEGPMRVAPSDPGGVQADYQDLTVTRVASAGAEEGPTDKVVLAPSPVALEEEDVPMAALIDDTPSNEPAPRTLQPDTSVSDMSAIEMAIAEALAVTDTTAATTTTTATADAERVSPAMAGGLRSSKRPEARPATLENVAAASTASQGLDVDVTTIPPGTRLVQLGAYPSMDEARRAWDEFDARFSAYFDGKRRVVQEASAGGSTFYRLRAMGFQDLSDARRFCAVLVAENANCIPVIRR